MLARRLWALQSPPAAAARTTTQVRAAALAKKPPISPLLAHPSWRHRHDASSPDREPFGCANRGKHSTSSTLARLRTERSDRCYSTERSDRCGTKRSDRCETERSDRYETERSDRCETERSDRCETERSDRCDSELRCIERSDRCETERSDRCKTERSDRCDFPERSNRCETERSDRCDIPSGQTAVPLEILSGQTARSGNDFSACISRGQPLPSMCATAERKAASRPGTL